MAYPYPQPISLWNVAILVIAVALVIGTVVGAWYNHTTIRAASVENSPCADVLVTPNSNPEISSP